MHIILTMPRRKEGIQPTAKATVSAFVWSEQGKHGHTLDQNSTIHD